MSAGAIKILIIDDEADICFFLDRDLTKRGFNVTSSHSLAEAANKIKAFNPNVLLLDNHLPDGRGIDFLERVNLLYPKMKVIMITAHDSQQDRKKAYNIGVDFFLSKPFTMKEVNEIMDRVVPSNHA